MPVCAKMISSWVRKVLGIAKAYWCWQLWQLVFPWCPYCRLVTGPELLPQPYIIFLLTSILPTSTRNPFNKLSWVSLNSHLGGEFQTLTHKKSWRYVGLSGDSSPSTEQNSFPIFCAVSPLASLNYCCRDQGLIAQHPLLNVCPYCFIELWAAGLPEVCHCNSCHALYDDKCFDYVSIYLFIVSAVKCVNITNACI